MRGGIAATTAAALSSSAHPSSMPHRRRFTMPRRSTWRRSTPHRSTPPRPDRHAMRVPISARSTDQLLPACSALAPPTAVARLDELGSQRRQPRTAVLVKPADRHLSSATRYCLPFQRAKLNARQRATLRLWSSCVLAKAWPPFPSATKNKSSDASGRATACRAAKPGLAIGPGGSAGVK